MSLLRGADFFYALRFLRLLTTKWEDTTAFELGIVDKDGKKLKKPQGSEEKGAYTSFHRLVYNIKRLLNKLPFGKTKLASYATALFLIKEHTNLTDEVICEKLEIEGYLELHECKGLFLNEDGAIQANKYFLVRDLPLKTGEPLAKADTEVVVEEHNPIGHFCNVPIFKAHHVKTKQSIYITQNDIIT
tara:strand:+ start:14701 stop:15264 length:564 start_codon:yes stop_codon:yes gene_type:complete